MTDDSVAALRAAYEKTTPGTWDVIDNQNGNFTVFILQDNALKPLNPIAKQCKQVDAEFIVAAHQHTPALLAECERLRAMEQRVLKMWHWLDEHSAESPDDRYTRDDVSDLLGYVPLSKPKDV